MNSSPKKLNSCACKNIVAYKLIKKSKYDQSH